MRSLLIVAPGRAAPQGSKRHVGHGVLVESSKRLPQWRTWVTSCAVETARLAGWATASGPVRVGIECQFTRPAGHFGRGRNAGQLKPSAPASPTGRNLGDADKLARGILDALVMAGVIADDALVVQLDVRKQWGTSDVARVTVEAL